jgi:hypothetical protein
MTASISLVAASVDFLILLALLAALASPRLSQPARPLIAISAFACAWLLGAVCEGLRAPDWTLLIGGALMLVSIVVTMVTVHVWAHEGGRGESGPGQRGDDGGGERRRRRPDAPQGGGGGGDPSWWPEFERQLTLYVAEREKRQPACSPPVRDPHGPEPSELFPARSSADG